MLNPEQQKQVTTQIEAYERKEGTGTLAIPLGDISFELEVDEFVASPAVMNSGVELVAYLAQHSELVRGKVVVDMGAGSGVIGIAAAKLGAKRVIMVDIDARAVANAKRNISRLELGAVCEVVESNLFGAFDEGLQADVQIFNHPFFAGELEEGKEWTRMMLGETELLDRYFEQAPRYSKPDAVYLMPWLTLAANEEGQRDNDPGKRALEHGFEVTSESKQLPLAQGLQQGTFKMYLLRKQ